MAEGAACQGGVRKRAPENQGDAPDLAQENVRHMSIVALDSLLVAVGDDLACGPNLEYDLEFQALERAAAPKSERSMGDSVIAAEEPDWQDVAAKSVALLARTKDLRVALHLTTAWLRLYGLPGFAAGLEFIQRLLEDHWATVHPQLDADDDDDPTFRVNSVAPLGSVQGVLPYLRSTFFVQSQRLGRFSLRDLRIANGSLKPSESSEDKPADLTLIEAACKDCPEQLLADNTAAASQSLDRARAIDKAFEANIGIAGPDLKPLLVDLAELKKFLDPQLARRRPVAAAAEAPTDDDDDDDFVAAPSAGVAASGGRIASPQDVIRRIDEICEYYQRLEPSSPVPLLLRRAQRLVGKDFLELLRDLAPTGIAQLQVVSGVSTTGAAGAAAAVDDDDD